MKCLIKNQHTNIVFTYNCLQADTETTKTNPWSSIKILPYNTWRFIDIVFETNFMVGALEENKTKLEISPP